MDLIGVLHIIILCKGVSLNSKDLTVDRETSRIPHRRSKSKPNVSSASVVKIK